MSERERVRERESVKRTTSQKEREKGVTRYLGGGGGAGAGAGRRMRREGRMHGYELNKQLVGVKVSNKPTNRSKLTAKCGGAKYCCHRVPLNKSSKKSKGERKAHCLDVSSNHLMHEWALDKQFCRDEDRFAATWATLNDVWLGSDAENEAEDDDVVAAAGAVVSTAYRPSQPSVDKQPISRNLITEEEDHKDAPTDGCEDVLRDAEYESDGNMTFFHSELSDTEFSWSDGNDSEDHYGAEYDDWFMC